MNDGVLKGPSAAERGCFTLRSVSPSTASSSCLPRSLERLSTMAVHPTTCIRAQDPAAPRWGRKPWEGLEGLRQEEARLWHSWGELWHTIFLGHCDKVPPHCLQHWSQAFLQVLTPRPSVSCTCSVLTWMSSQLPVKAVSRCLTFN